MFLLALSCVFGATNDLVADSSGRLPADHAGTFAALTGTSFAGLEATTPGVSDYITVLERGYALHELTFAALFILLLAVPFRQRRMWAWWAAWLLMIANLGYTYTFGVVDSSILRRSLIADIALPVLLLAHLPAFFRQGHPRRT